MAVAHLGSTTPAADTETQILAESVAFDYFVSVVCANKGMGDVRVSVYAKAVGAAENEIMYFVKDQVVAGNTTFETKKMTLADDHALYVKSSHPVVSFGCTGLKTDKVVD
ncbi:MAG: hypothetical protein EBT80_00045 [Chitinophagales bacterium]|nr:hypothetical protein [Chitinophagales bacterium]